MVKGRPQSAKDAALVRSLGVDLTEDIITGAVGAADLWEIAQEIGKGMTPRKIFRAIDREITRGNL